MADFAEYLRTEGLSKRQQIADQGAALTDELLQSMKNKSAPIVGGSTSWSGGGSGGGIESSVYSGPLNLPSMKGGKVRPVAGRLSQGWGKSRIPYAAGRHTGLDFGVKSGTRVGSAANGVVVRVGREGAYGNAIHVRQGDGTTALYAHLSGINVKPGQRVKAGQQIGVSGNTGRSFGAHLHFEVRKTDKYGGDINPNSWFSTR